MDANGQGFWQLADAAHWRWRRHTRYGAAYRALELNSERTLISPLSAVAAHDAASNALEQIPHALDEVGALACWQASLGAIVARSALPGDAVRLPLPGTPSDLLVSRDGVLHALLGGGVRLHDLRGRWTDLTVEAPGFRPWRAAADPDGSVWLLERASGNLGRVLGRPLRDGPPVDYDGRVFRPDPENCDAPRIDTLPALDWPDTERPVALACDAAGPVLLSWVGGDGISCLRRYDPRRRRLGPPRELAGARYAYALALLDGERIAVRVPGRGDAPAYAWPPADGDVLDAIPASGAIFPLSAQAVEAPFVHVVDGLPHYPEALDDGARGAAALHPLSMANLAEHGEARHYDGTDAHLLDSGSPQTVWHRLYAEARIPPRCGFIAWLAATQEPKPPTDDDPDAWLPHRFGDTPAVADPHAAQAAWEAQPSELPHHPGLAPWPREPQRAGLFSVLIQHPRRRVRRLVGRYLWVRVVLFGDRRSSPQIAALRAWSSRFSYRDRYLPRLYRESESGVSAQAPGERLGELEVRHLQLLDAAGVPSAELLDRFTKLGIDAGLSPALTVISPGHRWRLRDAASGRAWTLRLEGRDIAVYRPQSTASDFLDRMLASFEGVLTPIEDRIAHAHRLSDPATVPAESLDWLGQWIGVAFDPALPDARRRDWLAAAPELARSHGTRRGLQRALEIATGGGVSGGEIVVIEDFRLRRTLSTLIGVNLDDEDDPLLPGLIVSGNSVVGDTLFVGDGERKAELLALFRDEVTTAAEDAAVIAFDERLAHRATVLVHQQIEPQDLGLIRRIVELEAPAHAQVRVVSASAPFMVGVASLVGVDSYLGRKPPQQPVRVDRSTLGRGDRLIAPACLDPRIAGAAPAGKYPPPVAKLRGPDVPVSPVESFELDGSASAAAPQRSLDHYQWTLLPPST